MLLTVDKIQDHLLLTISDDVLMDNSKDFLFEFQKATHAKDFKTISLNFEKVKYVDSSGVGSIIKSANTVRAFGTMINVFNLNKALHSVFRLSGLHNIMNIFTLEEFLAKFPDFKSQLEKKS